jgi:hypothetical protein
MRCGFVHRLALLGALVWPLACAVPTPEPPSAEFLVATPDSTFWVQTGESGVRVRGVPMTLAVYNGGYHELYVAGIDRAYTDAIFEGERVYQRDLVTGDSTVVLDDSLIVALADRYLRSTPDAQLLTPDDPDPDDPLVVANGETDLLGVRGSYVWLEHRSVVQSEADEQYDTVQVAVDLRTAHVIRPDSAILQAAEEDSSTAIPLPRRWHRHGYDLLAERERATGAVLLSVHDPVRRSWPILRVNATPRIYWIDTPALPPSVREALRHAFNQAAQYDEAIRYARSAAASVLSFLNVS